KIGGRTYFIVKFVLQVHNAIASAAMNVAVEFCLVFDTNKRKKGQRAGEQEKEIYSKLSSLITFPTQHSALFRCFSKS
ncbi:hypothetical protein, partial [Nodularia sp. UHCC 0506]|uniref:hypothetical protein n=1 Tax=Nodularia sp. UHCC 0506 TaxID=3110243 RepID=UPI002B1EC7C1